MFTYFLTIYLNQHFDFSLINIVHYATDIDKWFHEFLMLHIDATTVKVWKLVPKNIILKVFNEFNFSQNF